MTIIHLAPVGEEPTAADLVAIEREWPLIEAERDLLDAEIACLTASPSPSALDRRRVRRAERRVLAIARDLAANTSMSEVVA